MGRHQISLLLLLGFFSLGSPVWASSGIIPLIQNGDFRALKKSLNQGADPNQKDFEGNSAVYWSVSRGDLKTFELLLQHKASLDVQNRKKENLFFAAVESGQVPLMNQIYKMGVSPHHRSTDGRTPLMVAAFRGRKEAVDWLLDHGAQVLDKDENFWSPLRWAIAGGHSEVASLLIDRGAKIDEKDHVGNTALMEAARRGDEQSMILLLSRGADRTLMNQKGETAYTLALRHPNPKLRTLIATDQIKKKDHSRVDTLKDYGLEFSEAKFIQYIRQGDLIVTDLYLKNGMSPNAENADQVTALMTAAEAGHVELVRRLIEAGAAVNRSNARGETALFFGAKRGHISVVEELVFRKADVNHVDSMGRSPLILALTEVKKPEAATAIVRFLLKGKADPNRYSKEALERGETPLFLAAAKGMDDAVSALLRGGAKMQVQDSRKETAFFKAIREGHLPVVRTLMNAGALDASIRNQQGLTAAAVAIRSGREDIYREILAKTRSLDDVDTMGNTLLMTAILSNQRPAFQILLQRGAKLSVRNRVGDSPLTLAAMKGQLDIVRDILRKGAEVNSISQTGRSPLMWAIAQGYEDIAQELLGKGARVNQKDVEGMTPLRLARERKDDRLVQLLLSYGAKEN